jgi:hypothetical protein
MMTTMNSPGKTACDAAVLTDLADQPSVQDAIARHFGESASPQALAQVTQGIAKIWASELVPRVSRRPSQATPAVWCPVSSKAAS